ncbi:methyltransferase domain-containing protein [Sphingomonas oryzagri]
MSVADAFGRAAHYDAHAAVQRIVAEKLAERILALPLPPGPRVLEIGCGTGFLGLELVDDLAPAHWRMTDIAPAMVDRARQRLGDRPNLSFAVMDGEHPDVAGRFDLICSSLSFQWFGDLGGAVARLRRRLSPEGRLVFTTLAEGSFFEWRRAHGELAPGTRDYPSAEQLAAIGTDVEIETIPMAHKSAREFLRSVKGIGAGTPRNGHRPLTPAELRAVMGRFEAKGCVASYMVATCIAGPL